MFSNPELTRMLARERQEELREEAGRRRIARGQRRKRREPRQRPADPGVTSIATWGQYAWR
jgi:hypothetical protein